MATFDSKLSGVLGDKTAKAFKDALPLTGIVLTKMDGDARGGAGCGCSACAW